MIPTSYLFKQLYQETWGDPSNPHAVPTTPPPTPPRHDGHLAALVLRAQTRLIRLLAATTARPTPNPSLPLPRGG